MKVRTRFAPSPTGDLHIGGVRTALFAYLFARHYDGEFLLRIEDTDRQRSTQHSLTSILQGMSWLGLEHDGEVIYQSQRAERYQQVVKQLLDDGKAYRCYCSKQRLDTLRAEQMATKQKPRYDGHCRNKQSMSQGEFVVRFKNPQDGVVSFDDLVLGKITIANSELDDLIIARSDGTPTYNLTVVVDDWDMEISHIIRGADHINNTPRQINLLQALAAPIPVYAHVPMIHGDDGKKLSKRRDAVNVMHYRDQGYLPQALLNYLVRLGWSHHDQEVFDRQQMISLFDGQHLSKSATVFDHDKLLWLNQLYLKQLPIVVISQQLLFHFEQLSIVATEKPSLDKVIALQAPRVKTLRELAEQSRYFYQAVESYDDKAAKKHLTAATHPVLVSLIENFERLSRWQADAIHAVIVKVAEQYQLKLGKVAQPIRVAITGNTVSPSIDATLQLLGQNTSLHRLRQALQYCSAEL